MTNQETPHDSVCVCLRYNAQKEGIVRVNRADSHSCNSVCVKGGGVGSPDGGGGALFEYIFIQASHIHVLPAVNNTMMLSRFIVI